MSYNTSRVMLTFFTYLQFIWIEPTFPLKLMAKMNLGRSSKCSEHSGCLNSKQAQEGVERETNCCEQKG